MAKGAFRIPGLNEWLFVIGLACYWPTFRNSFFGLVFQEGNEGFGRLDVEYPLCGAAHAWFDLALSTGFLARGVSRCAVFACWPPLGCR